MFPKSIIRHNPTFLDARPFQLNDRVFSLYSSDFRLRHAPPRAAYTPFALEGKWDSSPTLPWSSPRWSRQVLTASVAITGAGVGVAAWQAVDDRRHARPWFATWAPKRDQPAVHDLEWRTNLTDAAASGRTLDLSISANGQGAIAYVRHRPGADHSTVGGASFRVGRHGGLGRQVDVTWRQPVNTTVDVTASAGSTSTTLGRLDGPFVASPLTRYSVGP